MLKDLEKNAKRRCGEYGETSWRLESADRLLTEFVDRLIERCWKSCGKSLDVEFSLH